MGAEEIYRGNSYHCLQSITRNEITVAVSSSDATHQHSSSSFSVENWCDTPRTTVAIVIVVCSVFGRGGGLATTWQTVAGTVGFGG